jgi:hypothetical protein
MGWWPVPAPSRPPAPWPATPGPWSLAALPALSFVLLLTPTGSLPSARWRWWAWVTGTAPVVLLVVLAAVIALASAALGLLEVVGWAAGICVALLPLAIGAAILRYRLYDLDRILSRTLTWGLLTVLLGGGYAVVVLGLGPAAGPRLQPGGGGRDPGRDRGVPAGPPPGPSGGGSAVQPAPP